MERGTIVLSIFSIFNILSVFVQDAPYFNHAAGSQASMIIGKTLALLSLRGVVSSQRLHGVVIDNTLHVRATDSGSEKIHALIVHRRGVIIHHTSDTLPVSITVFFCDTWAVRYRFPIALNTMPVSIVELISRYLGLR